MIKGTTPTFLITVTGGTMEGATPFATLRQGKHELTKSGEELVKERGEDYCALAVSLTQDETLQFERGKAELQVRWVYEDGTAGATGIQAVAVKPILKQEVIAHE